MELKNLNIRSFFFLIIFVGLGFMLLQVLMPFLNIIVISVILTQLFYPVYKGLTKATHSKVFSSILTTLVTVSLVVIPLTLVVLLATSEIINLTQQVGVGDDNFGQVVGAIESLEDFANTQLAPFYNRFSIQPNEFGADPSSITIDIAQAFQSVLGGLSEQVIIPTATTILGSGIGVLFYGILLVVTLIYLFMEYENIPQIINRISPLDDEVDILLYNKFTTTSKAVIVGNFVVALVQATVIIPILLVLGIGAPALLWIIMFLFSLVPVGSGIVWVPVGLFMIISGNPLGGILLIIYGALALNIVEATVRPYLLKDSVQLHPLIIIFTALGGITIFGVLGILYGPLLAVFFKALMDIYTEKYATAKIAHD